VWAESETSGGATVFNGESVIHYGACGGDDSENIKREAKENKEEGTEWEWGWRFPYTVRWGEEVS